MGNINMSTCSLLVSLVHNEMCNIVFSTQSVLLLGRVIMLLFSSFINVFSHIKKCFPPIFEIVYEVNRPDRLTFH